MGRLLVMVGVALALVGALVWLGSKIGLGKLPGDIVIRKDGLTVYLPIVTSIVLSILLTLLLNLWVRRR